MNFKECCVNANANASPLLDTAAVHAKVAVNVIVDVEVNAIVNVNDHISVDVDLNAKVDADADVYAVGITCMFFQGCIANSASVWTASCAQMQIFDLSPARPSR